jgi:general secretion pathway protein G
MWREARRLAGLLGVLTAALVGCAALIEGCGRRLPPEQERFLRDQRAIEIAREQFIADCGRPPTAEEGLQALIHKPSSPDLADFWNGPYLTEDRLNDYWGRSYHYGLVMPKGSGEPKLIFWSAGQDGEPYTPDDVYRFHFEGWQPPSEGRPKAPACCPATRSAP